MGKVCEHCGKELPDGCTVCDSCGTFQTSEEEKLGPGPLRVKFTLPKIIFSVIAIAALVGLVLLGRSLNRDIYEGGGFESALENVVAYENGKISKIKSLAPREYWNMLRDNEGFSIDSFIAQAKENEKKEESEAESLREAE